MFYMSGPEEALVKSGTTACARCFSLFLMPFFLFLSLGAMLGEPKIIVGGFFMAWPCCQEVQRYAPALLVCAGD